MKVKITYRCNSDLKEPFIAEASSPEQGYHISTTSKISFKDAKEKLIDKTKILLKNIIPPDEEVEI